MNPRRQRGLTVMELIVAVSLGAFLVTLAVSLMLSSNAGFVAQAEAASVDDAGRYALAAIERAARQTAFVDWEREDASGAFDPAGPPPVRGLDAASLSGASAAIDNPRAAAVNGSDILALRFAGSGAGDGDGSAATCAGFSVGAGQQGWSIFYVGLSAAGDPELRCKYRGANSWTAEAVIGGVDSFQVLYGIDSDAVPDGVANRYVKATDINAMDAALDLEGATDAERQRDQLRKSWWKRVASIKVALVLHGAKHSRNDAARSVYELFGAAYGSGGDEGTRLARGDMDESLRHRERREFAATILLRNPLR